MAVELQFILDKLFLSCVGGWSCFYDMQLHMQLHYSIKQANVQLK